VFGELSTYFGSSNDGATACCPCCGVDFIIFG
jgi:hypothetical protein